MASKRVRRESSGGAGRRPAVGRRTPGTVLVLLVDGGVVGYLPRDLTRRWQPRVLAAESEGYLVTGTAAMYGGTKDQLSLGVFGDAVWPGSGKAPRG